MRDDKAVTAQAPAISVVIPARNAARYLAAALESLATQTFRDFEIVAVDNGSTDRTAEILRRWTEREPRLRLLSVARPGLAATLNHGIHAARAPLIARLDADDIALPDRLMRQARAFAEPQDRRAASPARRRGAAALSARRQRLRSIDGDVPARCL
jgi:glycosyltransferase involved in cell wall biosynthesis